MIAALSIYNCIYVETWHGKTGYHDGDTFRCTGDVRPIAPDVTVWEPKVRLARVDAPEGDTASQLELINWLYGRPFNLICYGRDKYGRLLADAERGEGLLSQYMLDANVGVVPMTLHQARDLVGRELHDWDSLARAITHPSMLPRS